MEKKVQLNTFSAGTLKNTADTSEKKSSLNSDTAVALQDDTLNASLASRQLAEKVRSVGEISQDGLLYILKEEKNGWLYVESGKVRGFVKESELYTGDAAQVLLSGYQKQAKKAAEKNIFCSPSLILVYLLYVVCIQPCDKFIQRRSIYSITRLLCRRRILRLKSVID